MSSMERSSENPNVRISLQLVGPPMERTTSAASHISIDLIRGGPAETSVSVLARDSASSEPPSGAEGAPYLALVYKDLSVKSNRNGKVLLDKATGRITSGALYAVMGPSGSGKTTFLNVVARRLDHNFKVTGELRLNGRGYSAAHLKSCGGYVMQDDVLNASLTCRETLQYTAELRMPPTLSPEEREARIDTVLAHMGLLHVQNVLVGSPMKKGISGGERKRLCVAQELLMKPLLLFLDEPTSGLDSVTALSLITRMRYLTDMKECTVVTTIHQPQAKIFALFGSLLLLNKGKIVYQGPAQAALQFFADGGNPCPMHENPADHFLDVISPNFSESMENIAAHEKKLTEQYSTMAEDVDVNEGIEHPILPARKVTPWTKQFKTLFRRTIKEQYRRKGEVLTLLGQTVVMAVLIGTAFLKVGPEVNQAGVSRMSSVIFFCAINQGVFGALMIINSFPSERMLSLRERAAGTYYVSAYFLAKTTAESLFQIINPIIFSCIVYFLIGFQPVAFKFFIFTAFMVLTSMAATSVALMVSAWARTTSMAVIVLPMVLEVSRLFGGFFISPATTPGYFKWLSAMSFVEYAYIGASLNEFSGLTVTCTPSQQVNGVCPISIGEQQIATLGLDMLNIPQCVGILISYITITRILGFIGVRYVKW